MRRTAALAIAAALTGALLTACSPDWDDDCDNDALAVELVAAPAGKGGGGGRGGGGGSKGGGTSNLKKPGAGSGKRAPGVGPATGSGGSHSGKRRHHGDDCDAPTPRQKSGAAR